MYLKSTYISVKYQKRCLLLKKTSQKNLLRKAVVNISTINDTINQIKHTQNILQHVVARKTAISKMYNVIKEPAVNRVIENYASIEELVQPAVEAAIAESAFSQLANNEQFCKMGQVAEKYNSIAENCRAASVIIDDSALKNFRRLTQNRISALEALQLNSEKIQHLGELGSALSELVREPAWKSLSQMAQNNTFAATASAEALAASQAFGAMTSMIESFEKPLRLFKIPNIERHIENVLSQAHSFDPSIWDDVRSFDLSHVDIRDDGVVVCDGETYDSNEFTVALNEQTQLAQNPAPEKSIILFKTILLLAIFAPIFLCPDSDIFNAFVNLLGCINIVLEFLNISESIGSYSNTIDNLLEKLGFKERHCWIIKEYSGLKADTSIDAVEMLSLPYGTQLQVLDEIPCWYQVKFTDQNGNETIGWIPTEHVKNEHQIKQ